MFPIASLENGMLLVLLIGKVVAHIIIIIIINIFAHKYLAIHKMQITMYAKCDGQMSTQLTVDIEHGFTLTNGISFMGNTCSKSGLVAA